MDDDVLMLTAGDALSPRQVRRKAHLLRHKANRVAIAALDLRIAAGNASLVSPPSENVPTPENVPAPAVVSETIQQSDIQLSEMASCGPITKLVNALIVEGGVSNRAPESTTTRCPSDVLDDCSGGHLEFSASPSVAVKKKKKKKKKKTKKKKKQQSLDVALVEEDSPIPWEHSASPVGVGEFPVDAPRGNSALSPGPVMYDMPMLDSTAPSVDYACYDACRADSWQHERVALEEQLQQRLAGAGARAHRGLRSAVT